MVKLIDVAADGTTHLITDGFRRFEDISEKSIEVPLMDTAYVFKKGHRLELAITHSHFPSYAPNRALMKLDQATIHFLFGSDSPSHISFPILT